MTCRILIYSLTGNTLRIGEALAWELGAQLHEIDATPPEGGSEQGLLAKLRRGMDTLKQRAPDIAVPDQPWEQSDLLILGGSVEDGHLARPLRQWLDGGPALPDRVAFVVTSSAGTLPDSALREMSALTGRDPVAVLYVTEDKLERDDYAKEMHDFLESCVVRYRKSA